MEKYYKVNAQSERNGIIFHSKTCPLVGIATFRDQSGEIQRIIVPIQLVNYINYLVTLCEKKKSHSKNKALIFDVLLITICLLSGKMGFVFMAVCFSLLVSFNLFTFIEMSYEMKLKDKLVATATTKHCFINETGLPQRLNKVIPGLDKKLKEELEY